MTNRYFIPRLFIFIFLIFRLLPAQNYLWPTNASTYMSSSFCEYREGHYHSAIDVKTWVREGYKCFAIEDGKIERIRVSPFGYGKVLYLRLKDGRTAVYAHLQKFNNKIEKMIREQQLNNEKYRVNWYPKNLQVKKGDVIAYTGRTGIGVPHLHFEIRNKKDRPINPLIFYTEVKDDIRPRLKELGIVPISPDAMVNSSMIPQTFDVSYIRNGINVIKDPIYVKGRIGLILNGFDQANDVGNKYGFHETIMSVNGKEIFRITYDELHFSTTAHINTEIYYPMLADQRKVFHKLYVEPFNPLSFYTRYADEDGTIIIGEKPVNFEIIAADFHGNKSILKGELIPDSRPDINVSDFYVRDSSAVFEFSSKPFKDLKFYFGNKEDSLSPVNYFEILGGKISQPDSGLQISAQLNDTTTKYFRIDITGKNGISEKRLIHTKSDTLAEPEIYLYSDRMIFEFETDPVNKHFLHVPSGKKYELSSGLSGRSQILIPAVDLHTHSNTFQLISNSQILWENNYSLTPLAPGQQKTVSWYDSSLSVKPGPRTFIDNAILMSEILPPDSISAILPTASNIYTLHPGNIPVFQSAEIKIKADSIPAWGNWGIFKTNGRNSLAYVGGLLDTNTSILSTTTSPFGNFIVACDTIPPIIEMKQPKEGAIYKNNPQIKFFVTDEFSGIGAEKNISILIDGKFVLPEWDPEDDLVIAKIDNRLNPGNHTLTISVQDQSSNVTRQAVYFIIK